MKLNYRHAIVLITLSFLLSAPVVAAAHTGGAVVAQDIGGEFLYGLLQNGAELVFTSIGPEGEPAVVYAQLGIPSEELGLSQPMYDDCMLMALVSTHGELLDYILDLFASDLFNATSAGSGEFIAMQDGGGAFDINSILQMLGTDFNLLINIFVNADEAAAQTNMGLIKAHMNTMFGFTFSDLFYLRIDQSFFPPESGITLPFDSIDIFISQVLNPFEEAVTHVFSVMDDSGFLGSIEKSVFTIAPASGAGIVAIPNIENLIDLINSTQGEPTPSATSFITSQMPDLQGSLAIAFAGYIGDQLLSTSDTELNIFEDILGKSPTATVTGLSDGQSYVICSMPGNVEISSYSPEDEASNRTYYDNVTNMVFWNATDLDIQPDYSISFDAGNFPPLVTIVREFSPLTTTPGGSAQVTVAVYNAGDEAIANISLVDDTIASTYTSVHVSGTTSDTAATIAAHAWLNMTYTVTFDYEGGYAFAPAHMTYNYNGTTYHKQTHMDGYTVSPDPLNLLIQMFNDGMPFTGIAVGVIGLGAIINIALMIRGRGGKGSYQV
jgi:hypothetical protein